jgi:hypothetical protein
MRRIKFESRVRTNSTPPRIQPDKLLAELAAMRSDLQAKVEARRQEEASALSESVRKVVMDLTLNGPTGSLARCLLAKHTTSCSANNGKSGHIRHSQIKNSPIR